MEQGLCHHHPVLQNFANLEVDNSGYGSDHSVFITAMHPLGLGEDVYIIDSGATKHMVMDKSRHQSADYHCCESQIWRWQCHGAHQCPLCARLNEQPDLCVWHKGWQMGL